MFLDLWKCALMLYACLTLSRLVKLNEGSSNSFKTKSRFCNEKKLASMEDIRVISDCLSILIDDCLKVVLLLLQHSEEIFWQ